MIKCIGIIHETKNEWERRTPLIPADVKKLSAQLGVNFVVQPSDLRIYSAADYRSQGAEVNTDLSGCDIIFGIKEIKIPDLLSGKVYLFFSHTIKGQSYNMPMLRKIMEFKSTLIDYERMIDDRGKRLIYFSYHAGLSGIIDTIWAFGKKLALAGIDSPFLKIKHSLQYANLDEAEKSFGQVAAEIRSGGLPLPICPLIIGITGYGNVSRGVQHLLDILPARTIAPAEITEIRKSGIKERNKILKVVFREEDMVEPVDADKKFDLQDYYKNPSGYRSRFEQYLPGLNILVNASFWNTQYPKHVTKKFMRELYAREQNPLLQVIGDISCDVEGGVECTLRTTTPGNPVFTYLPDRDDAQDGFAGRGLVIMAVDNLPSELPLEASNYFSSILKNFIPDLVRADYSVDFDKLALPPALKRAVIVYQGKLTPEYQYLEKHL